MQPRKKKSEMAGASDAEKYAAKELTIFDLPESGLSPDLETNGPLALLIRSAALLTATGTVRIRCFSYGFSVIMNPRP